MQFEVMVALEALVNSAWEEPSLKALIDPLIPSGNILEVGFGYSSHRLQAYHPKQLTIIEPDPASAANAIRWAKKHPHIFVLEETWENSLGKLGTFDALFFYHSGAAVSRETGHALVKQGKALLAKVGEQLPHLAKTRYSNEDIEDFFTQVGQHQPKELANFLYELKESGQISSEQYENITSKHNLEKKHSHPIRMPEIGKDTLVPFLEACLIKHTRKGSRIFCFSTNPVSKYESPEFFDRIITNPNLEYQEKMIGEGLVSIVEKLI